MSWSILDKRNLPKVDCWYAHGIGLELEWSPVFRGIYLKVLCFECHIGFWRNEDAQEKKYADGR